MKSFFKFILLVFTFLIIVTIFAFSPIKSTEAQNNKGDDTQLIKIKRGNREFESEVLKETPDPETGKRSRPGNILVKFKANTSQTEKDKLKEKVKAQEVEKLYLGDTFRIKVSEKDTAETLSTYKADPNVEYVTSDKLVFTQEIPNDPRFSEQWGMTKINAPVAWDFAKGSPGTRIAILDCGIYDSASTYISPDGSPGHPDVRSKVVSRINFTTSRDADDFCNHGTHVAGIAAASTNNNLGVAGTAYNTSLVNVKVLGDNGSGSFSWIINGMLWAAGCETNPCGTRRAEVINMSLGANDTCDPLVQSAIDKAWSQGLVIVAAAGNDAKAGSNTPGNCNNVISVSASTNTDTKASYSNYGSGVDVAAPGTGILSTDYVGGYSTFNGTSMASPHVAGLAALLWTTQYNTGNAGIVNRIFQTANHAYLAGSTYGRIDAYMAVSDGSVISPTPSPILSSTPTLTPTPTQSQLICTNPVIVNHSDTNVSGSGIVTFSWAAITGATSYRVQRQNASGSWSTRTTTSQTAFSGSDSFNDPNWRVYVSSGSCTPIPGPSTTFDP